MPLPTRRISYPQCHPHHTRKASLGTRGAGLGGCNSVLCAVDRAISGHPAAEGCSGLRPWTRAALLAVLHHLHYPRGAFSHLPDARPMSCTSLDALNAAPHALEDKLSITQNILCPLSKLTQWGGGRCGTRGIPGGRQRGTLAPLGREGGGPRSQMGPKQSVVNIKRVLWCCGCAQSSKSLASRRLDGLYCHD